MNELKPILMSRTVWSSLVGIGCLIGSILGVETRSIDQGALTEAFLQVGTGLAFIGTIVFRVAATRKLTP